MYDMLLGKKNMLECVNILLSVTNLSAIIIFRGL